MTYRVSKYVAFQDDWTPGIVKGTLGKRLNRLWLATFSMKKLAGPFGAIEHVLREDYENVTVLPLLISGKFSEPAVESKDCR